MTNAPMTSRSFTVAMPLERVVRLLTDADAMRAALAIAHAAVSVDEVLGPDEGAAFMFGDIVGFTPLIEAIGDRAAVDVLAAHETIVDTAITVHDGYRAYSAGDGFMAVFRDAAASLRAAREMQRALLTSDIAAAARTRVGIHAGPVIRTRTANGRRDFVGRNVITASRIADASTGGQVLASDTVRRATEPFGEFRFRNERSLVLKGLRGIHRVAELDLTCDPDHFP